MKGVFFNRRSQEGRIIERAHRAHSRRNARSSHAKNKSDVLASVRFIYFLFTVFDPVDIDLNQNRYPDPRGRSVMKDIGSTFANRTLADDNRTLESVKFEIGDYLAVTIFN